MARLPRLSLPGVAQLVAIRGNDKQPVFRDDDDRAHWLGWLAESARARSVEIHAYAQLVDSALLLLTPATAGGVAAIVQSLGRRYVRWFNDRHRRSGTLWEGRYRSAPVEPGAMLVACMVHVESAPVRAGLVDAAPGWPWSSCRHHIGLAHDPRISDAAPFWALGNTPFDRQTAYLRMFDEPVPASQRRAIEAALQRGRPLGGASFLEELVARGLPVAAPRPRGRPRREGRGAAPG